MIYLLGNLEPAIIAFVGILFAFAATCIAIAKLNKYLPKDMGRQFAHDGALSAGKPRGAGIIFVLTFVAAALLFAQMNVEIGIYLILIVVEMFTGYFDDAAEKPWGEYLKGFLDLAVAVVVALVYLHYNTSTITFAITGTQVTIPPVVFAILTVVLVWASINVTNCSDGVDGLSGTLTIITLMTIFVLDNLLITVTVIVLAATFHVFSIHPGRKQMRRPLFRESQGCTSILMTLLLSGRLFTPPCLAVSPLSFI